MIPILYDINETEFISNGLCRLSDCVSCVVTEERNGVYECDFEYPVTGVNYDLIQVGRIIGVTHDDSTYTRSETVIGPLTDERLEEITDENGMILTGEAITEFTVRDIQPFDIVSFSRPIDGIVKFHAVHISYRQSYLTTKGTNINSLTDAFTMLKNSTPSNPFTYWTDKASTGYLSSADGVPKTVRSLLGGVEGSILDAYGGEYEWDKFTVKLWGSRGQDRDFSIRYSVNMLKYDEDFDISETYSSCVPYWKNNSTVVVGDRQYSNALTATGRGECVPLDVTDKFQNQPTKVQVEEMAASIMAASNPNIPKQTIKVEFIRLQDSPEYAEYRNLLDCSLCDSINVIFPYYNTTARFKIVKTVWDVLRNRFESMELGDLSTTLAEALGIKK